MKKWYQKWYMRVCMYVVSFIPIFVGNHYATMLDDYHYPLIALLVFILGFSSSLLGGIFISALESFDQTSALPTKPDPIRVRVEEEQPEDELYEESMREVEEFLGDDNGICLSKD